MLAFCWGRSTFGSAPRSISGFINVNILAVIFNYSFTRCDHRGQCDKGYMIFLCIIFTTAGEGLIFLNEWRIGVHLAEKTRFKTCNQKPTL